MNLKNAILRHEQDIIDSMSEDNGKPYFESYMTELVFTINEINFALKNLRKWVKPEKVKAGFLVYPSKSCIMSEPYGVALIMGSWNFPFLLAFSPLVGAVAAGNCCIVQTSKNTSAEKVIQSIICETFDQGHVAMVDGDIEISKCLVEQKFDKIFFTGSPEVGKIIMSKAANNLTSVTLELGGKSPCIVDRYIDVAVTAKRILHGKFLNAGQACIAPDYLIVHRDIKKDLYDAFAKWINQFYSGQPEKSSDLARIINDKHYSRVKGYLRDGTIVTGGSYDDQALMITPTIMEITDLDVPVMREEIYGPILPVIEYSTLDEVKQIIAHNPDPLGLYVFSKDKNMVKIILDSVPFGGGCVNDTQYHFANFWLPFGGRGNSGIGSYHGKFGFDAFSHKKAVLTKSFSFDLPIFPPYKDKHKYWKRLLR